MLLPGEEPLFRGHLDRNGTQSLKSDLRDAFIIFARTTPELAAEYLTAVGSCEHNEYIVRSILKMRGTLAQAAPVELANLTAQALISGPRGRKRALRHGTRRGVYLSRSRIPSGIPGPRPISRFID